MSARLMREAAVCAVVEGAPPGDVACALRAAGADCLCEGARVVLLSALLLLERGEGGAWSGRSLLPGDEDGDVMAGAALVDALGWSIPWGSVEVDDE